MKFDFFTLGGRFYWEDVFNFQDWVIQKNIKSGKYRLLDPHNIRRESGSFEICKDTLLKYIKFFELPDDDSEIVVILHGFARTKASVALMKEYLNKNSLNTIAVNYCSLQKGISYHANILQQFIGNLTTHKSICFITVGAGCLVLRKMLDMSDNYRNFKISRVLDINPINSGSDFADILVKSSLARRLLGPMLTDISTDRALKIPQLPKDIEHGIIFCPSSITSLLKKFTSHYESFPSASPPNEKTYAESFVEIDKKSLFPLENSHLHKLCLAFLKYGNSGKKAENT